VTDKAGGAPWQRKLLAGTFGLATHASFLAAVTAMFAALYGGLTLGRGRLHGEAALLANLALALQFPLLHSFLLSDHGRALLARLGTRRFGRELAPTSYAGIAALQILTTFTLWSPSGTVWWEPHGTGLLLATLAYLGAWAFLGRALLDGGLGLQTGWIGWTAVWRGARVAFPPMADGGLFALCRQPIYLGFALTLWSGPVWTPDRLLLALVWSAYCVLGPLHKERRYERLHGAAFVAYRARVPYMLPRRRRDA